MKLSKEIAKDNVGKFIDCSNRHNGLYPKQIVEHGGEYFLKDTRNVWTPIPSENDPDFNFNANYYDIMYEGKHLKVRMLAAVRFNDKIRCNFNENGDFISPGGYTMVANGNKEIHFDFTDLYADYSRSDKKLYMFSHENLDFDGVPECKDIEASDLANISAIKEFFIYTDPENLKPVKIESISFEVTGDDGNIKEYNVKPEVLKAYQFD